MERVVGHSFTTGLLTSEHFLKPDVSSILAKFKPVGGGGGGGGQKNAKN